MKINDPVYRVEASLRAAVAVAVAATLILLGAPSAHGAEFFFLDHDLLDRYVGPTGPLVISGEIERGDYARLMRKIADDSRRFAAQKRIVLASNGGDITETLRIARFVRTNFVSVSVSAQTGPCVAACFLIYAAAAERATDGGTLLGLNRPVLVDSVARAMSPTAAAALESRALAQVRGFLRENEVPQPLVDAMFRRSSEGPHWLTAEEEQLLGFHSPAFHRSLVAHCGWDDALERNVNAGRRPFNAVVPMYRCRARLLQNLRRPPPE